jgi:hypothetical protein
VSRNLLPLLRSESRPRRTIKREQLPCAMRDTSFKDRQRLDRTVRDDLVELTTEIAAIKRGSE